MPYYVRWPLIEVLEEELGIKFEENLNPDDLEEFLEADLSLSDGTEEFSVLFTVHPVGMAVMFFSPEFFSGRYIEGRGVYINLIKYLSNNPYPKWHEFTDLQRGFLEKLGSIFCCNMQERFEKVFQRI